MISLVSAPVLGYDLVRHPQGDGMATVLLRALACGPEDVPVFAVARARTPETRRSAAWTEVRAATVATWATPGVADPDDRTLAQLITQMRSRMILDLDDLNRLIRTDILGWCGPQQAPVTAPADWHQAPAVDPDVAGRAGEAFLDAIASLWTPGLSNETRRLLAGPFLAAGRTVPWREADLGPLAEEVRALLSTLGRLTDDDRGRLRAATGLLRASTTEWAAAVHEASWATLTTGRIRASAAAQLLAVRAFGRGGLDASDGAEGVWNAVSGHLHATVVADVLPDDARHRLAAIWHAALVTR
jgi:hypothetical protein